MPAIRFPLGSLRAVNLAERGEASAANVRTAASLKRRVRSERHRDLINLVATSYTGPSLAMGI